MIRFLFTLFAVAIMSLPLAAQTRADRDARAAIALAVASSKPSPVAVAAPRVSSAADVMAYTLLHRKPVLVSVGVDCSALCDKICKEIPTTHCKTFAGDSTPRLCLVVADADGNLWEPSECWRKTPTEKEVRAAAHQLDKAVNGPKPSVAPMPAKQSATPNVGNCVCGGGSCFCLPASKCANGQCPRR